MKTFKRLFAVVLLIAVILVVGYFIYTGGQVNA